MFQDWVKNPILADFYPHLLRNWLLKLWFVIICYSWFNLCRTPSVSKQIQINIHFGLHEKSKIFGISESLKNIEGLQSKQRISSLPFLYATCSSGFFSPHCFILKKLSRLLTLVFSFTGFYFLFLFFFFF